uniref:extracellular matrix organizing protein FRAS1-like n=1 Tax=Oncorhynchus gorbuscha TaxID=8017 RepID=UPI001EAECA41|nr:extracellular matrix organizing protein FRAS1-like [Oncorhynchus gorbuscha]
MERTNNGQHYRQTNSFTMDDVYQNRISYNHDGSNSLKDRFTFTVADGTNVFFMVEEAGKEVLTAAPQMFKIDILPVDDGTPRIVINLGLQWLEYTDNKVNTDWFWRSQTTRNSSTVSDSSFSNTPKALLK